MVFAQEISPRVLVFVCQLVCHDHKGKEMPRGDNDYGAPLVSAM
jgi:hypothetical protein